MKLYNLRKNLISYDKDRLLSFKIEWKKKITGRWMNDKVYFWMVPRVEYLKYKNISLQSLFRNIFVPKKLSKLNGYFSFSKKKKKIFICFHIHVWLPFTKLSTISSFTRQVLCNVRWHIIIECVLLLVVVFL